MALPIDACTVMGMVTIVGSILSAPALATKTLDVCAQTLFALEDKIVLPHVIFLLPNARDFTLQINNNKLEFKSFKAIIKNMGLSWSRLGCFSDRRNFVQ